MGGVEGDEVQHVGDGADQGEEGGDEGDEKTEKLKDNDERAVFASYTYNTVCLDREDTDVMLRARIVIPTAGNQY